MSGRHAWESASLTCAATSPKIFTTNLMRDALRACSRFTVMPPKLARCPRRRWKLSSLAPRRQLLSKFYGLTCKLHSSLHAAASPSSSYSFYLGATAPTGGSRPCLAGSRRQLRDSVDRQHGRPHDIFGCAPSPDVAVLRADGDAGRSDWRLHYLCFGPKRWQAGDGAQALEKESSEGLRNV